MTQENKELLLKDLLGRVLYGVKVDYHSNIFTLGYNLYLNNSDVAFENYPMLYFLENIESVKPYLRPMSSMTNEEDEWLNDRINFSRDDEVDKIRQKWGIVMLEIYNHSGRYVFSNFTEILDWLNAHHFDYRGLIEKGLAFEAPENMYK